MTTNIRSSSVIESNRDLLVQILLRLPVKSLLVFKSVSKRWFSLISEPQFVHNHCLQYRPSIPGFFLSKLVHLNNSEFQFILIDRNVDLGCSHGPASVPFKTLNDPVGINIKQSCNGLFLCSKVVEWRTDYSYTSTATYYVYNPSTMHYKIIPSSPFRKYRSDAGCYVSLAFDPLKSPHYQVISICSKERKQYQIDIYSSETDSWRLSGDGLYVVNEASQATDMFFGTGVYWNGSLHWISSSGAAIYFDIDSELLRHMPMPSLPDENGKRQVKYFGVYKGHMHLIEIYDNMNGRFDILEMEIDYRGWNVKYRLDLNDFITVSRPEINWHDIAISMFLKGYEFSILKFFDEEKEERGSSKLVIQLVDSRVFLYDLKEMSFKKIHDLLPCHRGSLLYGSEAHLYIPTLAHV